MKYMKQVHQHKRYVTEPPTLLDRIVAINSTGRCQRVGSGGLFLFVQMLAGTESPAGVEHAAACRVLFAPEAHTAAGRRVRTRPDATGCDCANGWSRPEEMAAGIAELIAALHPEPALGSG